MYHLLHLKVHWYNFQMHNAKIIITINLKKVIQYKTAGGEPFRGGVGAACVKTPHFATKKGGGGRNRRCESKHTISRGDWGRMGQNSGRWPFRGGVGAVWVKTAGGGRFEGGLGPYGSKRRAASRFEVGLGLCGSKRRAKSHFEVEWG